MTGYARTTTRPPGKATQGERHGQRAHGHDGDGVRQGEKHTPRSIRFHDTEWKRIEAFAEKRGMAAAEFVWFAALDVMEGGAAADEDGDRLAPLIERTFRYSYMMATKMRNDMRAAGSDEELQALVRAARGQQDEVLSGRSV